MMHSAALVATMAIVSFLLRALPFILVRKEPPKFIAYLGKVLPPAIIGMLVVYCLKDISVTAKPFGLPELIACVCTAVAQAWKRNSIISILTGTVVYILITSFI
jgi:branched-subunit amino acid transport protein AzlD